MRPFKALASLLLLIALVVGLGLKPGIGCTFFAQAQDVKAAKAPAASIFHITGTVINSVTRSPISGCKMTATPAGRSQGSRPQASDEFATDDQGRFDVSVAAAGAWRLTARARGYVTQALDTHEGFSSAVVLTSASPTLDVVFPLMPNAWISGTVLDEASEPIRQARVTLQAVTSPENDNGQESLTARGATVTDDRGHYELANLAPGDYRVGVQAQVWYAQAAQTSHPDPTFDVIYPVTWFPGVTDSASASTITLHGGDSGEADFHLVPMPAVHLRLPSSVPSGGPANGRQIQTPVSFPQILPITSNGVFGGAPPSITSTSMGQVDTGGIAPGLYQVNWPDSGGSGAHTSLIQITASSSRSLDINSASVGVHLTLKLDGTGMHNVGQITFVDVNNPSNAFRVNELMGAMRGGRFRGGGGGDAATREPHADMGIDVLPGRYRVVLSGDGDQYLTGITATGAEATGRLVTVRGDASLLLHIASGRPTVSGFVRYQGKPSVGAQVLLIPATFGEPESLTIVRRDQSNTDGSYDLAEVIPGQYILIAIDHGWQVNWNDPATLRMYLIHGIPLDLRSGANIRQEIQAQAP